MATLFERGDAQRGDRIAINARRLSRPRIIARSGRHEAQESITWDNVYCIIEVPLKARPQQQGPVTPSQGLVCSLTRLAFKPIIKLA